MLENYKRIKTGLGLDRIEIDRFNSKNSLCLIIGSNGSCKTTIMNEITPLPIERMPNRGSVCIVPGKIGKKEIDFLEDKKYLYKCKIIFDKNKTSCFISKENVLTGENYGELNENGNVTSYIEVIERELGWSKNYINVGYLSSKITNVINMKPQERNDYLSVWLPSISEYIDAYKVTQKKYNVIKRQINMLTNDIGKLSLVDYEISINNYKNTVETLEKELEKINEDLAVGKTFVSNINPIDSFTLHKKIAEYQEFVEKHNKIAVDLIKSAKEYHKYMGEKGKKLLLNELNEITKKQTIYETKISNIDKNITDNSLTIEELAKEIEDKDIKTKIIDTESIILQIDKDIENLHKNLEEIIKEKPDMVFFNGFITDSMIDNFVTIINNLYDMSRAIDLSLKGKYIKKIEDLEEINKDLEKKLTLYTKDLDYCENKIIDLTNRIYLLENMKIDDKILSKKPSICKMKCGIIDELLTYISPEGEIKSLKEELIKIIGQKSEYLEKEKEIKEELEKIKNIITISDNINNFLYRNTELLGKFPEIVVKITSDPDIFKVINKLPYLLQLGKDAQEFISCRSKINTLFEQKRHVETDYKLLKNKYRSHKNYYEALNKREKLLEEKNEIINKFKENKDKLALFDKIDEIIEESDKNIKELNKNADYLEEHSKHLEELAKDLYKLSHLNDILYKLNYERSVKREDLEKNKAEMEVLKNKLNSKKTLIETRDNLIKQLEKLEVLLKVWSPKVGYPAWEIEDFLDQLTIQTNKDLEVMWGSNLLIEQCKLGPNEFSIIVNRNGTIIDDASECSEGEIATLSLALSFAIIEINIKTKKYNVIRMDEVDGVLDTERRRGFLDIVNSKLSSIDCGNVWVISHNNEFDAVDADIILLKGAKLSPVSIQNKNIIFDYNTVKREVV